MSMGITTQIEGAPRQVIDAISNASRKTGIDFDYLVNQARTESSFQTDVKAKTSSATGLYQFIDQTWLQTVSKHGSKHGLQNEASAIQQDFQGRFYISDDTQRDQIMNLRKNPNVASLMAAEFALDNKNHIEGKTGIEATSTDLYFGHFLGAGGASKFIKAMQDDPYQPAAYLMPAAARSNKNIFYNSDGSQKSLSQIYNDFQAKFEDSTEVQTASNGPLPINDRSYQRDIQFERMYGDQVAQFIRNLPSINGFENGGFFDNLLGNQTRSITQNQVIDQSLFFHLTMLDTPK
jgi:hypothetical protein